MMRKKLPNSQRKTVDRDDLVKNQMEKQIKLAEKKKDKAEISSKKEKKFF